MKNNKTPRTARRMPETGKAHVNACVAIRRVQNHVDEHRPRTGEQIAKDLGLKKSYVFDVIKWTKTNRKNYTAIIKVKGGRYCLEGYEALPDPSVVSETEPQLVESEVDEELDVIADVEPTVTLDGDGKRELTEVEQDYLKALFVSRGLVPVPMPRGDFPKLVAWATAMPVTVSV